MTFLLLLIVYVSIRHHFIQHTKGERKVVRQVDAIEKLLLAAVSIAVMLLPILYLFTPLLSVADYAIPTVVRWTGAGVLVWSLWLFWRSHVDLGANWSVSLELRENHQLVSTGVYRHMRHPMYASIWLWAVGQAMILGNWIAGWAVLPAFAAMYFIRTPREERLMCELFGDEYRAYCRQTGRILPRWPWPRS